MARGQSRRPPRAEPGDLPGRRDLLPAVPFCVLTAAPEAGRAMVRAGLCATREEIAPPWASSAGETRASAPQTRSPNSVTPGRAANPSLQRRPRASRSWAAHGGGARFLAGMLAEVAASFLLLGASSVRLTGAMSSRRAAPARRGRARRRRGARTA
jgi:hypothetical protein